LDINKKQKKTPGKDNVYGVPTPTSHGHEDTDNTVVKKDGEK
jgi:hypothetical protein